MTVAEEPFRPREKLVEKQKYFQSIHKHTYLKGRYDKITSVAIPLALAGTSLFLIVSLLAYFRTADSFLRGKAMFGIAGPTAAVGRGIYNMSHGIGKKE